MPPPKQTPEELAAEAKKAEEEKKREEEKKHTDWFNGLTPDTQDYITGLRNENAKHRTGKTEAEKELEAAQKKAKEYDDLLKKQAEDQGKYKELYEKTATELDATKGLTERIKSLEGTFTLQLDEALKSLPASMQAMVKESGKPIEKQLVMANEIKAEIAHEADGPGSTRPGGGQPLNTEE